jgi:alkanesulfonate monooxygenase SsuD/methylene tetrahydromethanopterin reductase-like flavin-dependent oxidoreductase (luciferase family)
MRGPIPPPDARGITGATSPLAVTNGRPPAVVGSPSTVRAGIEALAAEYRVDEVLVVTIVWDHQARVRSYELVAEAFDLRPTQSIVG